MNRSELLAAVKGKPVPYTAPDETTVLLRPITLPERIALFAWHDANKDAVGYSQLLREQYFALGVCDKEGDPLFKAEEVAAAWTGPAIAFDAIADEVARRAGLGGKGDDAGKDSPATPS